jgi:hypothetical protein
MYLRFEEPLILLIVKPAGQPPRVACEVSKRSAYTFPLFRSPEMHK